jgi:selenocysteine lyase/cysteine desulfurase
MGVSADLSSEVHVGRGADLELAERNFAVWAGLRVALADHFAQNAATAGRRAQLLARIEAVVDELPNARRLGDGSHRSGTCSVILRDPGPEQVYRRLLGRGVNTWVGHGSHTPLFAPGEGAGEFLRISLGARTTEEEVDRLLTEFRAAAAA